MIKISANKLNLIEEYNEDIIILTSYFSLDFDKNLLESFKKFIHNKIRSLILQDTPETVVREEYLKQIEKYKEAIRNFQIGRKKLRKMLSELQGKMVKIRQREDDEYEKEYLKEQRILFKKFFKKYPKIKEIIEYTDSVDLFRLSFLIKKKERFLEDKLKDEEEKIKKRLKEFKNSTPNNVGSIDFQRPFTYHNFLVALLTNSDLNIKISREKPFKNPNGDTGRFFKMVIEFNPKKVYSNFFTFLKMKQFNAIDINDPSVFNSERFLQLDLKKEYFEEIIDPIRKYIQNFIEYKIIESNLGFKLNFNKLFYEIWKNYKDKYFRKKSFKKAEFSEKKRKFTHTPSILTAIGVSFIVIIIILAFIYYSPKPLVIDKYDRIKIHYSVWESNEHRTYDIFKPIINQSIQVDVIAINDTSLETPEVGLILGLYNNLLGKELYYDSDFIWLNRCVDEDYDGFHDVTGEPALSFGNSFNQYFDTCLIIKFKVLSIQKNGMSLSCSPNLQSVN